MCQSKPESFLRRVCLLIVAVLLSLPAWSQNAVWRCGNEFTNQPGPQPETRGCRLVDTGVVITPPEPRPPVRPASSPSGARTSSERVDRSEQQARDRDARFILESELRRAQERVADLTADYNQGNPTPLASEQGQAERYRERTAELRRRLERAQSDVAAIERELARLPATR